MTLIFSPTCRTSQGRTQTAHEIFIQPLLFSVDGFEVDTVESFYFEISPLFTAETRFLLSGVNTSDSSKINSSKVSSSNPSTIKVKVLLLTRST